MESEGEEHNTDKTDWASNMRLLLICFLVSGICTICTYFLPVLRNIPIFGTTAAQVWLWTLNPSLAYVGQGIIMGTETTLHMALGAIVGWGILSPLAKFKGWAPGPVDDWEHGSKGWIVWISLAIMLADAVVSLAYTALRPVLGTSASALWNRVEQWLKNRGSMTLFGSSHHRYSPVEQEEPLPGVLVDALEDQPPSCPVEEEQEDALPEQLISDKVVVIGLVSSILLCVLTIYIVFGDLVPLPATIAAVIMALLLSIMGVRALGETDLNPVSGISKLAQLFFALIIPQSNKSSVLINLVAGAVVSIDPPHPPE